MKIVGTLVGLTLLLCSLVVVGQTPPQEQPPAVTPVPYIFHSALGTAPTPIENGAWVLQIISRGGLAGGGRGDITADSAGKVVCANVEGACRDAISAEQLKSLSVFVTNANAAEWGAPKLGYCSDCYSTMFILKRREANGEVKTFFSYWDDTTWGVVHEKGFPLFDALMTALK
ncbi:MAG: hypothetical protein SF339_00135 [Blastocatellia bacterium]|nr:hypothetical protein [Blastocatellia bacterium]